MSKRKLGQKGTYNWYRNVTVNGMDQRAPQSPRIRDIRGRVRRIQPDNTIVRLEPRDARDRNANVEGTEAQKRVEQQRALVYCVFRDLISDQRYSLRGDIRVSCHPGIHLSIIHTANLGVRCVLDILGVRRPRKTREGEDQFNHFRATETMRWGNAGRVEAPREVPVVRAADELNRRVDRRAAILEEGALPQWQQKTEAVAQLPHKDPVGCPHGVAETCADYGVVGVDKVASRPTSIKGEGGTEGLDPLRNIPSASCFRAKIVELLRVYLELSVESWVVDRERHVAARVCRSTLVSNLQTLAAHLQESLRGPRHGQYPPRSRCRVFQPAQGVVGRYPAVHGLVVARRNIECR